MCPARFFSSSRHALEREIAAENEQTAYLIGKSTGPVPGFPATQVPSGVAALDFQDGGAATDSPSQGQKPVAN